MYEVNTDSKQVRRLNGVKDPTPRQGKDGEWRSYSEIMPSPIKVGTAVVILWGSKTELLPETKAELEGTGGVAIPVTSTSPVVAIEP